MRCAGSCLDAPALRMPTILRWRGRQVTAMREVTTILDIVDQNRKRLLEAWREHFDD